jgi:hypothetical protein
MSFLDDVRTVDPDGAAKTPRNSPRSLIESIVTVEGLAATTPARVRIDGHRGYSSDVSPTGDERLALLASDDATLHVEPDRTTRVVAMDVGDDVVVIAIEPGDDHDLRAILDTADDAAATIDWP